MRPIVVNVILLAIAISSIVQPAWAQFTFSPQSFGAPFITTCGFSYAQPFTNTAFLLNIVNRTTLTHDYTGSLAILFMPAESHGARSSFIAAPIIAQIVDERIACDDTYFFTDSFGIAG